MRYELLVLGGGPVGHALATRFGARGHTVAFVDDDARTIERAADADVDALESPLDASTNPHGLTARTVVAATRSDARNLLLAGAAPGTYDADRVVALVNDPDAAPAFADADVERVAVPAALARAASTHVERTLETSSRTTGRTTSGPDAAESVSGAPAEGAVSTDSLTGEEPTADRERVHE